MSIKFIQEGRRRGSCLGSPGVPPAPVMGAGRPVRWSRDVTWFNWAFGAHHGPVLCAVHYVTDGRFRLSRWKALIRGSTPLGQSLTRGGSAPTQIQRPFSSPRPPAASSAAVEPGSQPPPAPPPVLPAARAFPALCLLFYRRGAGRIGAGRRWAACTGSGWSSRRSSSTRWASTSS
jgi:hypothetical protein